MYNTEKKTWLDDKVEMHRATTQRAHKSVSTWIIIATANEARIFENYGDFTALKHTMRHQPPQKRFMRIIIEFRNKPLMVFHPFAHSHADPQEPLTFPQNISARMDEGLWCGDFEKVLLIAASETATAIYKALSHPVRARMSVHTDKILPHLGTDTLLKELPKTLYSLAETFRKGQRHDS